MERAFCSFLLFFLGVFILFFLIILIIFIVGLYVYFKHRKILNLPNITLITGGVKTGKTTLSVYLCIKKYKSVLRLYYFKKYFLFKKDLEKPLLYSNIPLAGISYVPLTRDLILRKKRFRYGSVVLIDECSLFADSQAYKDEFTSEVLTIFNKLFGHSTKNGYLYYNTQNVSDVHYAIKRVCSTYLWIQKKDNLPFFYRMYVREIVNSESQDNINTFQSDVDDEVDKFLLVPKKIRKCFDFCCYSIFTDNLPVESTSKYIPFKKSLKADSIVQVRDFHSLADSDEIKFYSACATDNAIKDKVKQVAYEKVGLTYYKKR